MIIASEPPYPVEDEWEYMEFELVREGFDVDRKTLVKLATQEPPSPAGTAESVRDSLVRQKAVLVLAGREGRWAIPVLVRVMREDPAVFVRRSAAAALAELGDERGKHFLEDALTQEGSLAEKVFLALRLAKAGEGKAYPVLIEAVASEDASTRFQAAQAVAEFMKFPEIPGPGEPSPSQLLVRLAKDPEPRVRQQAIIQFPSAVEAGAAIEPLLEAARWIVTTSQEDPELKEAAERVVRSLERRVEERP